ncbi:hypothetical protein ITJ86_04365 [Winogradskyella sp. F6397]|uniref:Bacteriophage abortive infection AbiH n=1 Tax=Winogradskyella marina TaxID=2785530 RepID=A0ABS0EFZ9_9FLAO|nr:AbiH family protein [Winogradskyella marina]MBF8149116.1 hypothetical protein [Winogradskyella marina]
MASIKTINKLFLVGNGFDRALGLKTTYEDFLFWYFTNFIVKALEVQNTIINDSGNHEYYYNTDLLITYSHSVKSIDNNNLIENFKKNNITYEKIRKFINNSSSQYKLTIKSDLLKAVLEESIKGWVDIEGVYFKLLKKAFKSKDKVSIDSLNKDIVCLTKLLKDYLSQLDISKTTEKTVSQKYIDQFISPIVPGDVIYPIKEHTIKSNRYYFLNFNYTKTLSNILLTLPDDYFKKYGHEIDAFISHIHGDIDREEIVFGYGDEMDKDYKGIEELNDNRFFENIKSFKYNKAYEYRDLLRFLNTEEYQVIIYGHSCGLSDRLLLNEVFEHDNCKSIKIYYYNEAEFTTKTMDISRHFNSNQVMRQKIVEFDEENRIPQTMIS